MTAPDDLIRRDTAERAIRARQRDTEDSGIYAGLSVALQELAALPADPVAEAAGKLADDAIGGDPWRQVSRGLWRCDYCRAIGEWDNRRPLSEMIDPDTVLKHSQGCAWETYRAAVAARAKEGES